MESTNIKIELASLHSEKEVVRTGYETGRILEPVWTRWLREDPPTVPGIEALFLCLAVYSLVTVLTELPSNGYLFPRE
jgi:hypothetical protein